MTLKEELEILRGEPIEVFSGDPMDIPCIETSDSEKLCRHPVVSVQMITYNHEPYIRQAIEGVMMQKTDFEFELVIGEDCSQDKTREICFEYQKRYPDKIRVLWWHENVSKLGGNGRRTGAHCRGEFIALCEGDDYWTDPLKLQKQVDAMRRYPNVGLCFCGAQQLWQENGVFEDRKHGSFSPGVIHGKRFLLHHLFGADPKVMPGPEGFIMTATTLFRRAMLQQARLRFDVFNWRLYLGDKTLFYGLSSISDVFFLPDSVAVYRRSSSGIMTAKGNWVYRDSSLLRMYYARTSLGLTLWEIPSSVFSTLVMCLPYTLGKGMGKALVYVTGLARIRSRMLLRPVVVLGAFYIIFPVFGNFFRKGIVYLGWHHRFVSRRVKKLYKEVEDG